MSTAEADRSWKVRPSPVPKPGYQAESSTAGTVIDVPNIDSPSSVDVVTEPCGDDQQAMQIDDLIRDIGGAVKISDHAVADAFYLRGFEVHARDYRKNGFLDPTYTPRDFANVERIEILKGPASVLYGAGQPSGVGRLDHQETARPGPSTTAASSSAASACSATRSTSRALERGQESLLYRINAAYENEDSFRDYGFAERTFVSPSLTWVLDHNTTLTWEGEYVNDRRRLDTGVAAINGNAAAHAHQPIPRRAVERLPALLRLSPNA